LVNFTICDILTLKFNLELDSAKLSYHPESDQGIRGQWHSGRCGRRTKRAGEARSWSLIILEKGGGVFVYTVRCRLDAGACVVCVSIDSA